MKRAKAPIIKKRKSVPKKKTKKRAKILRYSKNRVKMRRQESKAIVVPAYNSVKIIKKNELIYRINLWEKDDQVIMARFWTPPRKNCVPSFLLCGNPILEKSGLQVFDNSDTIVEKPEEKINKKRVRPYAFVGLAVFASVVIISSFFVFQQKDSFWQNSTTASVSAPVEITADRTYNQQAFDLGDGTKKYEIHSAQIFYKDENGDFQKIDTTLSYDHDKGVFVMDKASYTVEIPEYADSAFEFTNMFEGADMAIKTIPWAYHVRGEAYNTEEGNYVLYKDAFGSGNDLKVYAYWGGLKKEIIINKKISADELSFDFELQIPDDIEILNADGERWDKSSDLEFKDKTIRIGKDGKYSYVRNALVWDSGDLNMPVDIMLYSKNGKIYLRKTIGKDILDTAVYPLFTDDTVNYYSGAGDGHVYSYSNTDWSTCYAGSNLSADYTWVSVSPMAYRYTDEGYSCYIYRVFFPFDTSAIDDGATITSAVFYFYVIDYKIDDLSGSMNLVQTFQASTSSLETGDYNQVGSSTGSSPISVSSISTFMYNSFILDSTGKSWIDKTGYTKLGIREYYDLTSSEPGGTGYSAIGISTSEETGTGQDPYLEVVTVGGDSTPPVQSAHSPANAATITDTTQDITFTTDENATCYLSLDGDEAYADMADDTLCTGGGTTSQSCTTPDLGADGAKTVYLACTDGTNADTADTNTALSYTLDTTPPVQSAHSPANAATITDTTPTITLTLNENGDCFASTTDESYDAMSDNDDCTGDGTTSISCTLSDLGADGAKNVYIACRDTAGNKDTADTNTDLAYTLDTTAPTQSAWSPANAATITDATQDITFTTDENATCYLSLDGDEAYADMADDTLCTGGGTTSQSCTTPDLGADGAKTVYLACTDGTNANTADTNTALSYTLDTCGDGTCSGGETCSTCSADCGTCGGGGGSSSHYECGSQKCIFVSGDGADQCSSDPDCDIACTTGLDCGTNGYSGSLFCQNNNVYQNYLTYTCNSPGTIASSCTTLPDPQLKTTCSLQQLCIGGSCVDQNSKYNKCNGSQCVSVDGLGADQCSSNSDCVELKHNECNAQQQCVVVSGQRDDECQTSSECAGDSNGDNENDDENENGGGAGGGDEGNGLDDTKPGPLKIVESVTKSAEKYILDPVKTVSERTKKIVGSPQGSMVTKTISTVGAASGFVGVASVAVFAPTSIFEIFLIPLRLFGLLLTALGLKKRFLPWGTVYDSVTKQPLDPAYVVLKNVKTGESFSAITDLDGRYGFLVQPGVYQISVRKTNYRFPSKKLSNVIGDEIYPDLYFGQDIEIKKYGQAIVKNIPLDPIGFDWNEFTKKNKNLMKFYSRWDVVVRKISDFLFAIGLVVAIVAYFAAPYPYNTVIVGLYLFMLLLGVMGVRPKKFGSIIEKATGMPLSFAIIKVLMLGSDIEVAHRVADKYGRYYCLVPKEKYYVKIKKKNTDGSYSLVYTSPVIDVSKNGIIKERFTV